MEFVENLPNGKRYRTHQHFVDILNDDTIKISYKPTKEEKTLQGIFVPQIKYYFGTFTADFTLANSILPEFPDDVAKIKQGIELTEKVVQEVQAHLKAQEESND